MRRERERKGRGESKTSLLSLSRSDVARGLAGRRRRREEAAPFTRGSPDVTVALFNYSHAYALNGRTRVRNRPSASHAFSPTPEPHYVLRVCPPTGQGRRNHVESWRGPRDKRTKKDRARPNRHPPRTSDRRSSSSSVRFDRVKCLSKKIIVSH